MPYIDGFVLAVPTTNQEAYRAHALGAVPLFKEFGAMRLVEAWGDDVPAGKVTDFARAVQAKEDETVVFSWMEYPSREARDAAGARMMSDPRMKDMGASMPFDGRRMIYAGFAPFVNEGSGTGDYVDGFLLAVPADKRDAYQAMATMAAGVFCDHGAVRVVEAWGDDVPDGQVTDYRRAVQAQDGETIVFSWIEWPDKAARDAGMKAAMEDSRMAPDMDNMPFDPQRMIYGGFQILVSE